MVRRKQRPSTVQGPSVYRQICAIRLRTGTILGRRNRRYSRHRAAGVADLGMKILLDEAMELLRAAGAIVEGDMVRIGSEMVHAASRSLSPMGKPVAAPRSSTRPATPLAPRPRGPYVSGRRVLPFS